MRCQRRRAGDDRLSDGSTRLAAVRFTADFRLAECGLRCTEGQAGAEQGFCETAGFTTAQSSHRIAGAKFVRAIRRCRRKARRSRRRSRIDRVAESSKSSAGYCDPAVRRRRSKCRRSCAGPPSWLERYSRCRPCSFPPGRSSCLEGGNGPSRRSRTEVHSPGSAQAQGVARPLGLIRGEPVTISRTCWLPVTSGHGAITAVPP